jgi:hypothetical protein
MKRGVVMELIKTFGDKVAYTFRRFISYALKIIALSITTISVLAGVARKHNIMFPEAIIMRTVFCAMLIWTIHAIRLMPISLQN